MNQSPNMSGVVKRFRTMAVLAGIMSLLLWFVDLPVASLIMERKVVSQYS